MQKIFKGHTISTHLIHHTDPYHDGSIEGHSIAFTLSLFFAIPPIAQHLHVGYKNTAITMSKHPSSVYITWEQSIRLDSHRVCIHLVATANCFYLIVPFSAAYLTAPFTKLKSPQVFYRLILYLPSMSNASSV